MASNRDGRSFDAKLGASLSKLGGAKRLGGIAGGAQRLTSLRPARDLSLGGHAKRTFTPNIPVRRVKEEPEATTSADIVKKEREKRKDDKSKHDSSSQGRGRRRREIVASASIFSHGPFANPRPGGFSRSESAATQYSSTKSLTKSKDEDDITDESQRILDMLKEEGKIESDQTLSGSLMPITIPLASSKILGKKEELDPDVKAEGGVSGMEVNDLVSTSPSKLKRPLYKKSQHAGDIEKPAISCAELFASSIHEDELVFLQFPDALPINTLSTDRAPSATLKEEEKPRNPIGSAKETTESLEESLKKFSFLNVSEGYIGKLHIHKSGRVRLLLGNATLDVNMGIPCGFLQDLVSVHTEESRQEMLSLGHVSHRLICTPNYDDLLGS